MSRDFRPEIGTLLGDGARDTRALHLASSVNYHTGIVLKVEEVTFSPTNVLLLPDDDGGHDLLSELGLTLLDGSEEHVADRARRESVEPGPDTTASDHVQVLGTCVV